MKFSLKSFLAGVATALVVSGICVYGRVSNDIISVHYNDITLMVDGQEYIPTDANGMVVEPFIYGGTTYLPVRAVANAFGKIVGWDEKTYTVSLDTPESEKTQPEENPEQTQPEENPEQTQPEENPEEKPEEAGENVLDGKTAEEIVNLIVEKHQPQFMYGIIPVDMNDADSLKYFTGLDNSGLISSVAVCESMMGSQAYSLVVAKVSEGQDPKVVAESMMAGIDQNKWICVTADDIAVTGKGDVVMLIMIDSGYAPELTVDGTIEAFTELCGGAVDFKL